MRKFMSEVGHFYWSDHVVALLYVVLILLIGSLIQRHKYANNRYYFKGLVVKVFASYAFALIYFFVYKGGDTMAYFHNALVMNNLMLQNPFGFIDLMIQPNITSELFFDYFNHGTGYPYMSISASANNHMVVKFASIISLLGVQNFFASSILFGVFSYHFVFKVFSAFSGLYPKVESLLAMAFLYFPSFLFWSGGIIKETICIASTSYIVYSLFQIVVYNNKSPFMLFYLLFSSYILLITKPYLLFALIPGSVFWLFFGYLSSLKSKLVKFVLFPLIGVASFSLIFYLLSNVVISSFGGTDAAIERAMIIQQDLIRADQYGSNFYDIGPYEPSIAGIAKKAPEAITVGLYMPFLWQAKSALTLISALENLFLLFFTLYFLFKTRIYGIFVYTVRNPILFFCLSYALIIAFIVGITTANFGALVRYKTPLIPYFLSFFIIVYELMRKGQTKTQKVDKYSR